MSWLDEAENSNQAYQNAIQKFLSVVKRVSNMKFENLDIYPQGFQEVADKEDNKISVKCFHENNQVGGYFDLNLLSTAFGAGFLEKRGQGGYLHENRIFIESTNKEEYSINFIRIQYHTLVDAPGYYGNYTGRVTLFVKVPITLEELSNISEEIWADLFGWVLRKSESIPLTRLSSCITAQPINIIVDLVEKQGIESKQKSEKSGFGGVIKKLFGF